MKTLLLLLLFVYLGSAQDTNWECKVINADHGITVCWSEKYGPTNCVDCIGLWYNEALKQYRLTWKGTKFIEISIANITSIEVK